MFAAPDVCLGLQTVPCVIDCRERFKTVPYVIDSP
jgi:hypothetical protein